MQAFDHAARATKGARDYQEDSSAFWPPKERTAGGADVPPTANNTRLVAVLADGMGGHTAGALASRMVCDSFISTYAGLNGARPERLLKSLTSANDSIAAQVRANPTLAGMGTTLVAAVFGNEGVEWVSVGDSPLLLFRRGEIALLNEDHSLAPELDRLAALGKITPEQAKADPRRHMLRSAVTGDELDLVDVSRRPLVLEEGDYVILASDGLHTLESTEIQRIVSAYAEDGAEFGGQCADPRRGGHPRSAPGQHHRARRAAAPGLGVGSASMFHLRARVLSQFEIWSLDVTGSVLFRTKTTLAAVAKSDQTLGRGHAAAHASSGGRPIEGLSADLPLRLPQRVTPSGDLLKRQVAEYSQLATTPVPTEWPQEARGVFGR